MRVLVCGGRNFSDKKWMYDTLDKHLIASLVHGGAHGADSLAGLYAFERNIPVEVFPADWSKFGKRAGTLRNVQMANTKPDLVIAFTGGSGTKHMIQTARFLKIPVDIHWVKPDNYII